MTDMDMRCMLIKGLHELRRYLEDKEWSDECAEPHVETAIRAELYLKEHDPVKPRVSCVEQRCGNCNKVIEMDGWRVCPWCGKTIRWEEKDDDTH